MSATCPVCGDDWPALEWGPLTAYSEGGIFWAGRFLAFADRQLGLLHRLARSRGRPVHLDTLLMTLPGEASVGLLRVHLHKLRARLVEHAVPLAIETVHGFGYRLVMKDDA